MVKHNKNTNQILKDIQKYLIDEWDPIGVGDILEARDEYDSYVSGIYKILVSYESKKEIFDYLWWLEREQMGLVGDKLRTEKCAQQLLNLI